MIGSCYTSRDSPSIEEAAYEVAAVDDDDNDDDDDNNNDDDNDDDDNDDDNNDDYDNDDEDDDDDEDGDNDEDGDGSDDSNDNSSDGDGSDGEVCDDVSRREIMLHCNQEGRSTKRQVPSLAVIGTCPATGTVRDDEVPGNDDTASGAVSDAPGRRSIGQGAPQARTMLSSTVTTAVATPARRPLSSYFASPPRFLANNQMITIRFREESTVADDSAIPTDGNPVGEPDGHTSKRFPIGVLAVKVGHDREPVFTTATQLLRPSAVTLRGVMHIKMRRVAKVNTHIDGVPNPLTINPVHWLHGFQTGIGFRVADHEYTCGRYCLPTRDRDTTMFRNRCTEPCNLPDTERWSPHLTQHGFRLRASFRSRPLSPRSATRIRRPQHAVVNGYAIQVIVLDHHIPYHDDRLSVQTSSCGSNIDHEINAVCQRWIDDPTRPRQAVMMTTRRVVTPILPSTVRTCQATVVLSSKARRLRPADGFLAKVDIRCQHRTFTITTL
ncbi:hypothetical protein MHU86_4580 [Fragilaria crotonensis]|nr:hypothetical protein MHU86_4580 [Fragilaria crotonensis]